MFVWIETNSFTDLIEPFKITKLITTGALWSSFYSFIDVKKTDEANAEIRKKQDQESIQKAEEIEKKYKAEIKDKTVEANGAITTLVNKYNDLVEKYKKLEASS